ncbi:unnamed protein product [Dicrocoelium dendriticum]|nr:unnamed protein product [Dicrocoelium dendriticum]
MHLSLALLLLSGVKRFPSPFLRCYCKRMGKSAPSPRVTDAPLQSGTADAGLNTNNLYTGRKALEICSATVNSVPPVFTMFKETLKGLARPDYWIPDHLCKSCAICDKPFGPSRHIHHCRSCGRGVCEPCSPHKQPIPLRGLDLPHRICSECFRSAV